MADKDKYNIITILEAIEKIFQYSRQYSTADELYNCNRDFDASMMNFIVIGEMVARLSDEFTMENSHKDEHRTLNGWLDGDPKRSEVRKQLIAADCFYSQCSGSMSRI